MNKKKTESLSLQKHRTRAVAIIALIQFWAIGFIYLMGELAGYTGYGKSNNSLSVIKYLSVYIFLSTLWFILSIKLAKDEISNNFIAIYLSGVILPLIYIAIGFKIL